MIFVGICSDIVLHGIRAEPVGNESTVTLVGDMLSVVPVLFIFGFKVTEVDFVLG